MPRFAVAAAFLAVVCAPLAAAAGPGSLDPTFGAGGIVVTGLRGDDWVSDVAVRPDGRVVAAGWSSTSPADDASALVRYRRDGSLDPSFGRGGITIVPGAAVSALVVQPNGRIVVGGAGPGATGQDFFLARYRADGTLDGTFGRDGVVHTDLGPGRDDVDFVHDLALGPQNTIVAAGQTLRNRRLVGIALARYRANGALDRSFGTRGRVVTGLGPADNVDLGARGIVVQPDGGIVALAEVGNRERVALVRYTRHGRLDRAFGTRGRLELRPNVLRSASALARGPRGAVFVGGDVGDAEFAVAAITRAGRLQRTFGDGGTSRAAGVDGWVTAARAADGRIVAAGLAAPQPQGGILVARYRLDGTIDRDFATAGVARIALDRATAALALALGRDGVVVGGYAWEPGARPDAAVPKDFLLARLLG